MPSSTWRAVVRWAAGRPASPTGTHGDDCGRGEMRIRSTKGAASNRLTQGGRLPQLFYSPLFGAAYLLAGDTTSLTIYGACSAIAICMHCPRHALRPGLDEMRAEIFTSVVAERMKLTVRRLVDVKVRKVPVCGVMNRRQRGECLGPSEHPPRIPHPRATHAASRDAGVTPASRGSKK